MMVLEVAAGDQSQAMKPVLDQVAERISMDIDVHSLDDAIL